MSAEVRRWSVSAFSVFSLLTKTSLKDPSTSLLAPVRSNNIGLLLDEHALFKLVAKSADSLLEEFWGAPE